MFKRIKSALCRVLLVLLSSSVLSAQSADAKFGLGSAAVASVLLNSVDGAYGAPTNTKLPASVDHRAWLPKPGNQGELNSCVGWAVAYAAKTYQENILRAWGLNSNDRIFSPSFVYNQINGGQDEGSSILSAVDLIKNKGAASLATMPYTKNFRQQPNQDALDEAQNYQTESYQTVNAKDSNAVRMLIAGGNVVIFGMMVYENFLAYEGGVYRQTSGQNVGGHAMTAIGYDDAKNAYLVFNSWSERWGEKGYAWVHYETFANLTKTAVVMIPRGVNKPEKSVAPASVSASLGSYPDQVRVNWAEVQNSLGYVVSRSNKQTGPFAELGKTQGVVYIDKAVKADTMYYYSIKSIGIGGQSDFGPVANGFLQIAALPGVPQNILSQVVGTRVRLLWDTVNSIDSYNVYRWNDGQEKFQLIGASKDNGFEDASLPTDKEHSYWYAVTALKAGKESIASSSLGVLVKPVVATTSSTSSSTTSSIARTTATTSTVRQTRASTSSSTTSSTVRPVVQTVTLRAVRGARASIGSFTDRIVVSWQALSGADSYEVLLYNQTDTSYRSLATLERNSFVHRNPGNNPVFYAVRALAGGRKGPLVNFIVGRVKQARSTEKTFTYNDGVYFEQANEDPERRFDRQKGTFTNDSFFTDSDKFFDNFSPRDFFKLDVEAFFAFDEEAFFKLPDGF